MNSSIGHCPFDRKRVWMPAPLAFDDRLLVYSASDNDLLIQITNQIEATRLDQIDQATGIQLDRALCHLSYPTAVCCACDPEPTSRFTSGLGSSSSSKNTCDMLAS
jgi:hypothetical protein